MGTQQLPDDADILSVIDLNEYNREVARNAVWPERCRSAILSHQYFGRRTPRAVGVQNRSAERLEEVRLIAADAAVMQLYLRMGPSEGGGPLKRRDIVILVSEVEHFASRGCHHSGKCHANRFARTHPNPTTQRDDRVEHRANRVG